MAPCERSGVASATPSTIWKTCFEGMKWETWDEDVKELLEVNGGCENGTTFVFHMKNGQKAQCALSDVKQNESLTFAGSLLGGLAKFTGKILLKEETEAKTKVDYSFELHGFLGGIIGAVNPKPVVHGTEVGLANIRLSEEAEKSG